MDDERAELPHSDAEVSCLVDGADLRLPLYDLSPCGCMLEAPKGLLPRSRRLVVRFFRNLAVPARIAWQRGGRLGLRFHAPLQGELVTRLTQAVQAQASERYAFHDRFGRPVSGAPDFPNVVASLQGRRPAASLQRWVQP